jgi:hypothetical protein
MKAESSFPTSCIEVETMSSEAPRFLFLFFFFFSEKNIFKKVELNSLFFQIHCHSFHPPSCYKDKRYLINNIFFKKYF